MRVERVAQPILAPVARQIDMGDLTQRMHAGVGAAGAMDDAPRAALERGDRLLEPLLHRHPVLLPLPADERAAVIFDGEREAGHG